MLCLTFWCSNKVLFAAGYVRTSIHCGYFLCFSLSAMLFCWMSCADYLAGGFAFCSYSSLYSLLDSWRSGSSPIDWSSLCFISTFFLFWNWTNWFIRLLRSTGILIFTHPRNKIWQLSTSQWHKFAISLTLFEPRTWLIYLCSSLFSRTRAPQMD